MGMKPEHDYYADLVRLGAIGMADEEMSPDQRFSLAEAVRRAAGLPVAREENAMSDRMLHAALLRMEEAVAAEVDEDIRLAMHETAGPCCVRVAICAAIGADDDVEDPDARPVEEDAIVPTVIDMDEWQDALLDLADGKVGRDWELEPTLLEMSWNDRNEAERRLGIPEGYFDPPCPEAGEVAAADEFLNRLVIPARFRSNEGG